MDDRTTNELFLLSDAQRGMVVAPVETIVDPLAILRGDPPPNAPVLFRHNVGRVPRDFMMGGDVSLLLISTLVRDVFQTHGFTGWTTYPVEVRRKRGEEIPGYFGLSVTGRSQPVGARSTIKGLARHGTMGLVRGTAGTDDLFLSAGSAAIVVTGRVRDALRASGATNAAFVQVG